MMASTGTTSTSTYTTRTYTSDTSTNVSTSTSASSIVRLICVFAIVSGIGSRALQNVRVLGVCGALPVLAKGVAVSVCIGMLL